ncbi:MAG: hypothetical protein EXQ52_00610 [Bryobacterales bacterium]|nr:hypothetical protein [Bryobacterales bacterium]
MKDWRKLSTLSRVIGAAADTARRLLVQLDARGSEKPLGRVEPRAFHEFPRFLTARAFRPAPSVN